MTMSARRVWHIITGEFPPDSGGVGDYSALLSEGLARAGCEVHVWCPTSAERHFSETGISVHHLPHRFSLRGLIALEQALTRFPAPRTLLLQYVYNIYGCRGMNIALCLWLIWRRAGRRDDVRVMFHEPFYPFGFHSLRYNILAAITHAMAFLLMLAARVVYVSTSAWIPMLMQWNLLRRPVYRLGIPSTIGSEPPVTRRRTKSITVGHFGTYGLQMRSHLLQIFGDLITGCRHIQLKLLGRGAPGFASELMAVHPECAGQILALDQLPDTAVAEQIRSCDIMLQYYPDGVSSRRTTVMACLAHGAPVVTTLGRLSDPEWLESQSVRLAPADDTASIVSAVTQLLNDPAEQSRLAAAGYEFYHRAFALEHTVHTLLSA